ncbi:MAG: hypothetical protein ACJ8AW_32465, partial [Rhodopila sp.]
MVDDLFLARLQQHGYCFELLDLPAAPLFVSISFFQHRARREERRAHKEGIRAICGRGGAAPTSLLVSSGMGRLTTGVKCAVAPHAPGRNGTISISDGQVTFHGTLDAGPSSIPTPVVLPKRCLPAGVQLYRHDIRTSASPRDETA